MKLIAVILWITLVVGNSVPSIASEDGTDTHPNQNEIGVFFGGTTPFNEDAGGKTAPTIGVEYERKLNERFGVVALAEFVGDEHHRDYLFAIGMSYRVRGVVIAAGLGSETAEVDKPDGTINETTHFVIATRVGYEIHFDKISLAPTAGLDFVGETKTNLVWGISAGYGF